MRRSLFLVCLCAVLFFGISSSSVKAEGAQDFTVVNATGVTIDSLYISKVTVNDWEEDVLGVDTLPDGESVEINFSPDEEECKWDIMIKDTEGNAIYWRDVNLCEIETLTLHFEDGKAWATPE